MIYFTELAFLTIVNLHSNLRINALIPAAVNRPIGRKTHPGEEPESMAKPVDLMLTNLYLKGDDSVAIKGEVIAL